MAETTTAPAAPAAGARPEPVPAGERGRLRIADRVAERIAVAAARGVDGVAVTSGGLAGRGYPRAEVVVAGDRVRARLEIAGRWPVPAARLAADVRSTVGEQLTALAGFRVDTVDVTVATIVRDDTTPGRRVQ
ncbi:Asp23/Gls24 family envelope stress response protein [Cryptosporangium japonicum]|uniref:Asp23/Gls24 family envelope stress response protein n=1 Tax=Cryptosporangium japonicum TaxID=80872 RepID=A0ABP3DE95_9ACTN